MLKRIIKDPILLSKSLRSVMYITMGIIILAFHILDGYLGRYFGNALGIVILLYGGYRLYRLKDDLMANSDADDE